MAAPPPKRRLSNKEATLKRKFNAGEPLSVERVFCDPVPSSQTALAPRTANSIKSGPATRAFPTAANSHLEFSIFPTRLNACTSENPARASIKPSPIVNKERERESAPTLPCTSIKPCPTVNKERERARMLQCPSVSAAHLCSKTDPSPRPARSGHPGAPIWNQTGSSSRAPSGRTLRPPRGAPLQSEPPSRPCPSSLHRSRTRTKTAWTAHRQCRPSAEQALGCCGSAISPPVRGQHRAAP